MRLNSLALHNFSSFGEHQTVDFAQFASDASVLVLGENRDSAGANSNGSGKSSLLHAIPWALLGQIPNKASVDDVIRKGTDACFVELSFELRGKTYTVKRGRGASKKSNFLLWGPAGGDPIEFSTTTDAQKALLKEVGFHPQFAFTDFLNSAYFSVEAMAAFASKSGSSEERMALISRFLGLDVIDIARGIARTEKGQYSGQVMTLETFITSLNDELQGITIKQYKEDLIRLQEDKQEKEDRIENLRQALVAATENERILRDVEKITSSLDSLDEKYEDIQQLLTKQLEQQRSRCGQLLADIEAVNKKLATVDLTIDIEEIDTALEEIDTRVADSRDDIATLAASVSGCRSQLEHLVDLEVGSIKCPHCQGPLLIEKHTVIAFDGNKAKKMIQETNDNIALMEKRIAKKEKDNKELLAIKKEVVAERTRGQEAYTIGQQKQTLLTTMKRTDTDIVAIEQQLTNSDTTKQEENKKLQQQLVTLQQKALPDLPSSSSIQQQLDELWQSIAVLSRQVAEINSMCTAYEEKKSKLKGYQQQYDDLREVFDISSFWDKGFSTIRRWRVDHFLPRFEHTTNEFLRIMNTESRISLDTTRQKKKVKEGEDSVRASFTVTVTDDQGVSRSIETFSSGESRRIGIACGFALRELTLRQGTNTLEFMLLDEVIDNLDQTGVEEFVSLLPHINGLKLVISHDPSLQSYFDTTIRVIKEKGCSRIDL